MYNYPNYMSPVPNTFPNTLPKQEIIRVNGRQGAEAYQMMPNSSVLLLDETAPIVWLAQTDGAGYKTLTAYDVKPHVPEKPVDVKTLEERIAKLEAIINESNTAKSVENGTADESSTANV